MKVKRPSRRACCSSLMSHIGPSGRLFWTACQLKASSGSCRLRAPTTSPGEIARTFDNSIYVALILLVRVPSSFWKISLTPVHRQACQDIDDALHARRLPNGNIEAGVRELDFFKHLTPPLIGISCFRHRRCLPFCSPRQPNGCRGRSAWNDSLSGGQTHRHVARPSRNESLLPPTLRRAAGLFRNLGKWGVSLSLTAFDIGIRRRS